MRTNPCGTFSTISCSYGQLYGTILYSIIITAVRTGHFFYWLPKFGLGLGFGLYVRDELCCPASMEVDHHYAAHRHQTPTENEKPASRL